MSKKLSYFIIYNYDKPFSFISRTKEGYIDEFSSKSKAENEAEKMVDGVDVFSYVICESV